MDTLRHSNTLLDPLNHLRHTNVNGSTRTLELIEYIIYLYIPLYTSIYLYIPLYTSIYLYIHLFI